MLIIIKGQLWLKAYKLTIIAFFLYIFGIILAMISIFGNILRDFGLGFLVNSLFHFSINGYSNSSLYLVLISSLVMIEGIFLQNWSKLWTFKA